ncbi:hypothetical protein [Micromonospora sp. NPDC048843]|uniref:non-homologous end-joining DNA ligase LigD n=1 Tax=Micromonospora sp. NPDC048843 TaxID=3155389 RepID=UPI00340650EA
MSEADETRDGVALTNLDQPLSDRDDATKRDLVDYLDAVRDRILPQLRGRPLSVIRVRPGQPPFMQKNLPRYTPDWVRRAPVWAEASHREISYALCDDRRTLLWFANQRAVEYHPTLATVADLHRPTHLILDLDPPDGDGFRQAVDAALMPAPQSLPADLVAEGRTIPVARVQAMHEGKRRARARREAG